MPLCSSTAQITWRPKKQIYFVLISLIVVSNLLSVLPFQTHSRVEAAGNISSQPERKNVQNSPCDYLTVTVPTDANECGTLRFALNELNANPPASPQTITLQFANPTVINVTAGGYDIPQDVSIEGVCGNAGPAITLDGSGQSGDGLTLHGGSSIQGLLVKGFSGRQLKVSGPGNSLFCVRVETARTPQGAPASVTAQGLLSQTAHPNTAFAQPFKVLVKDANNNHLTGINVTFTAPASGASGTFQGAGTATTVATDAQGIATSPLFTANETVGSFQVTASVTGVATPATFDLHIQAASDLPPDPSHVAPPVDQTVATEIFNSTEFLYTGFDPIQTGVAPGTIKPNLVAVLRGRVLDKANQALSGVIIRIKDHPEFGQTLSRADGWFDLAVNGGGTLTINYTKEGFLPVQRTLQTPWQNFLFAEDVVMIALDSKVTPLNLVNSTDMQVAQGSLVTDQDGSRQATLLVPQGTTGVMRMPDGTTQPLANVNVRATEYTVGANGKQAMPGDLPATSGYTYAAEYSLDEAQAAGAVSVEFNQPIYNYVDNFINFPVGMVVPTGYYDRQKAAWFPSKNGRVIKILSITNGMADLDVTGDGLADSGTALTALNITDTERQKLATLYQAGKSLWRVPITHFTPWDHNWPYGPEPGAVAPNAGNPTSESENSDHKDNEECGSIIGCQSQTLGEVLPVPGTDLNLHYNSDRTQGYKAGRSIKIPVTGPTVPAPLKRVVVEIDVAGKQQQLNFTKAPNQTYNYEWDGKDAYGRTIRGEHKATVRVGYVYKAVYQTPAQFEAAFAGTSGVPISNNRVDLEITFWQESEFNLVYLDDQSLGLGNWGLENLHSYDPLTGRIYLGDGGIQRAWLSNTGSYTATVVAGTTRGYAGDGGPATQAKFDQLFDAKVAPDGSVYVIDLANQRVRRIGPDGIITTIAGTGIAGYNGDNIPATQAKLFGPWGLAVGPDGSVYIAEYSNRIRKVDPNGIITTVAGNGQVDGFGGDGSPATQARLAGPVGLAVGPDGSLYIGDTGNNRLRKVGTDGIITTIAGNGQPDNLGDGGNAKNASIYGPDRIALGPDGSVYFTSGGIVRRVAPDGIIYTVAGNSNFNSPASRDGAAATSAYLNVRSLTAEPDGTLILADATGGTIWLVNQGGYIYRVTPSNLHIGDIRGIEYDPKGSLYIVDSSSNKLIRSDLTDLTDNFKAEAKLPSANGEQIFVFDNGKHVRTLDSLTGGLINEFSYDAKGQLAAVKDGSNNLTTFERDANGILTAIVAPGGQRTEVTINAAGKLESYTLPDNERYDMTYYDDGLLKTLTDPVRTGPGQGLHSFSYDSFGRLSADNDPAGGFRQLARIQTADGYRVEVTTAEGLKTVYQVAEQGNNDQLRTVIEPGGATSRTLYRVDGSEVLTTSTGVSVTITYGPDARWGMNAPIMTGFTRQVPGGQKEVVTYKETVVLNNPDDPYSLKTLTAVYTYNGQTTTSVYDAATRTYTITNPKSQQGTTILDSLGRVTSTRSPGTTQALTFSYDAKGRLETTAAGSESWTYHYDSQNRLDSRTDANGQVTAYGSDGVGRITSTATGAEPGFAFGYDQNGNRTTLTMPGGLVHGMGYDFEGKLTSYAPPGMVATPYQFQYDKDGKLKDSILPGGRTITTSRQPGSNRISGIAYPEATIAFGYKAGDSTDRVDQLVRTPAGGGTSQQLNFTYNGDGVTGVSFSGAAEGSFTYSFDPNLFLTGVSLVSGGNTVTIPYLQDPATGLLKTYGPFTLDRNGPGGRLSNLSDANLAMSLSYDDLGRFQERVHKLGPNATNVYDLKVSYNNLGKIQQRVEIINSATTTFDYTYYPQGQLKEVRRNGVIVEAYQYDSRGNRTHSTVGANPEIVTSFDTQDRLEQRGSVTYQFNQDGFLIQRGQDTFQYSTKGELLQATVNGQTVTYNYDGLNRRVTRTDSSGTYQYLYGSPSDAYQVTAIRFPNGDLATYYYDEAGLLVGFERGGQLYYVATDQVGTPRLVSNSTGQPLKVMEWDSWGNLVSDSNPALELPIGYAGGLNDSLTGLTHFGLRDYEASSGRWTARDPLLFDGGQANLYAYVTGDPIELRDPTGLFCIGGSAYGGLGGGAQVCLTDEGYSVCGELGVGTGGSGEVSPDGDLASSRGGIVAEVKVKAGPIGAGAGVELKSNVDADGTLPKCGAPTLKFGTKIEGQVGDSLSISLNNKGEVKVKKKIPDLPSLAKSGTVSVGAKVAVKLCGKGKW
ncbi:MAG TPA: RHS repeat-associated core domain-containing protein [Chloroflexia bacterium]|nr:RHS repeat-associated core domain-containing protein [Chloroflexia bacterium]